MKKIRIKDIAKEAGVSEATISRYLNKNYKAMSEETRLKIKSVIEKNNYRPNNMARSLKLKKTMIIGVVLADIKNPFSSEILSVLSKVSEIDGYSLMISVTDNNPDNEEKAIMKLVDNNVDGLILNTTGANFDMIDKISKSIPTVLLDRNFSNKTMDVVTSNNEELTTELVTHLFEQGYQKLILFTEDKMTSSVRYIRENSFVQKCEELKLKCEVIDTKINTEDYYINLFEEYDKASKEEKIAIVAVNGRVFLNILNYLQNFTNIRKPKFGIATFDEYSWNPFIFGGITTVKQDANQIGEKVYERLVSRIDSGTSDEGIKQEIKGELIIRESTLTE